LPIVMSNLDHSRLVPLLAEALSRRSGDLLDALDEMVTDATVVPPTEVPADLVTMNSEVLVETPGGQARRVRLVYAAPHPANEEGVVSVFSPMGAALLGARVGMTVPLATGGKDRRVHVTELLYQPERSGDWDR